MLSVAGVGWLVDGCAGCVPNRCAACSGDRFLFGLGRRLGRGSLWEWIGVGCWGCGGLDVEALVVQGAGEAVLVDRDGDLAGQGTFGCGLRRGQRRSRTSSMRSRSGATRPGCSAG